MTSKRSQQNSSKTSDPPKKKTKIIPDFTSTAMLQTSVHIGDKTVTIVGYVDTLPPLLVKHNIKTGKEMNILKFIVNNNDNGRIQCVVWTEDIEKFRPSIGLYDIIMLEMVSVQPPKYNDGNMPYVIHLKPYSTITTFGKFTCDKPPIDICVFKDVSQTEGKINITGYLLNCFVVMREDEQLGTLTDGEYKLEVQVLSKDKVEIERGTRVTCTGMIRKSDQGNYSVVVQGIEDIKILPDEKMDINNLLKGMNKISD